MSVLIQKLPGVLKAMVLLAGLLVPGPAITFTQTRKPADFVNPFIGASTSEGAAGIYHGLGKTFPGATTPFGMVQVSPNTITGGDNGSGYSFEHKTIEGFALTQMSGVGWYGDMGNFLVMPTTGPLQTSSGKENGAKGYRSFYDKASEKASAGYYSVFLTDYKIKAELTATPHCGIMRFSFPRNASSRIQIDLARRVGGTSTSQYVKVVNENTIEGWMKCTPEGGGWGNGDGKADYTVYFCAKFSRPLKDYGVWSAEIPDSWSRKREDVESMAYQDLVAKAKISTGISSSGKHLGFFANFNTEEGEQILLKTGISYISIEGARNNLAAEAPDWNFEAVRLKARQQWNTALSKVKVKGGTDEQKTVFYTALYHTMIDPRIFEDVDGRYMGGDGQPHISRSFTKRTIFSGWDVFRSQMPLQTIINPSLVNDLINSLVTLADEKKFDYLERWEMLNSYSGCMIGNPAISVIADAYAKGIRGYDIKEAYQLCKNTAEKFGNGSRGYTFESFGIANTLEYAYFDWCVSRLASDLGRAEDAAKYQLRGQAYRNIFDPEVGWFRPKDKDGNWELWPEEGRLKQWYGCIESNPYQQGWFVPHDVPGMTQLMGGREKVVADLEQFFEKVPGNMMWNDYYNHANEPVHHVPFLFNQLKSPWLTQKWTREICARAYKNKVEGLVGNEDVGQMSAWYVLAAVGLHPVCPGDTRYEITSPVFDQAEIKVGEHSSKIFRVEARNNSPENVYIQRATLNGKPYNKSSIDHSVIVKGGALVLEMGRIPNKSWGI
ncbi:GH92 family glycosyl hydrolase [Pararcticibacter amylolyticus]|nr:GH92 family glycosyl hydrolase [Pararcticibacter amylolyticus]